MTDRLRFTIPGEMRGKGRPRFSTIAGRARAYTDAKTQSAEAWVRLCATEAIGGGLIPGPLSLDVTVGVGVPASWSKRKRAAALAGELRPTSKPDLDNVLKLIGDALNGIVWRDDAEIAAVTIRKVYCAEPATEVEVACIATVAAGWRAPSPAERV